MPASAPSISARFSPLSLTLPAAVLLLTSSVQAALRLEIDGWRVASMININPGGDAWPRQFTAAGGQLYFVADDSTRGPALRRLNGSTVEIAAHLNPYPAPFDCSYGNLTDVNGTLYFTADDTVHGNELWKLTPTGPVLVADLNAGSEGSSPADLTMVNGTLYFTAGDATHGRELWHLNGSGVPVLHEMEAGPEGSFPSHLTAAGPRLYFTATTAAEGEELYYLEGTTTVLVGSDPGLSGLSSGSGSIFPGNFFVQDGTLYFVNGTTPFGGGDKEIWRVRRVPGVTSQAELIFVSASPGPFSFSPPPAFATVGPALYFTGRTPATGSEIWRVADDTAMPALVADVAPAEAGSDPRELVDVNGVLYFTADDGTHGPELWRTTATGAEMVADLNPAFGSNPYFLSVLGGELFFVADDSVHGNELWRLRPDGTVAMVGDIGPGLEGGFISSLRYAGGRVYFTANDGGHGLELWTLGGGGTLLQVENRSFLSGGGINPGADGSGPAELTVFNDQLFFAADDGARGIELGTIFETDPARERRVLEGAILTLSGFVEGASGAVTLASTNSSESVPLGAVVVENGRWTWTQPAGLAPGPYYIILRATDSTGATTRASFAFRVTGPEPEIAVQTDVALTSGSSTVDFGTEMQGFTNSKIFTIHNSGIRTLTVSGLSLTGEYTQASPAPTPASPWLIPPGGDQTFTVSLTSANDGTKPGSLTIANDDADEAPFIINLTGIVQAPRLTVFGVGGAPEILDGQTVPLDFGKVTLTPLVRSITVKNTGRVSLNISSVSLPAGFTLVAPALPLSLAPGRTRELSLRYQAASLGSFTGQATLTTNDAGNPVFTFPIQALATPPCPDLSFAEEVVDLPGNTTWGMGVKLADINGDGHQDLLTIQRREDPESVFKLMVLPGDGLGHFTFEGQFIPVPEQLEIMHPGDFNKDGHMDLVLTPYQNSGRVSLMQQTFRLGAGPVPPRFALQGVSGIPNLGLSTHIAVADYDGDGNADLMMANATSHRMGLVRGDGQGHFSDLLEENIITTPRYPSQLVAADFNLDGKPDTGVVCRIGDTADFNANPAIGYQNGQLPLWLNDGTGMVTPAPGVPQSVGPWATCLVSADFNSDGIPDLATGSINGTISIRLGTGNGTFTAAPDLSVPNPVSEIQTGDFNGDGVPDLLTLSIFVPDTFRDISHLDVFLSQADGTFTLGKSFNPRRSITHITTGDFDHDGVSDFAAAGGSFFSTDNNNDGIPEWFIGRDHLWLYRNFSCEPSVIRVRYRDPFVDGVSSFAMGSTPVESSLPRLLLISNDGKHELTGLTATVDGQTEPNFYIAFQPNPASIPGQFELPNLTERRLYVTFRPLSAGPKTAVLHIASNDPDNNPFDIILTGTGTMDYDGWAGEYLLEGPAASPSANPSGDGVDNLLKYAFNLSPLTSNPAELVPGTGLSGLPRISTTFSGPAPVWRYEFIRRRGTGLTYTPEKSSTLGTWTALASEPTVTAIDDTWERVVHEEPLPPSETRQFGRVNVSAP